tara:strand:- start:261 stop:404 length:144 start_codon:yes stop_codon:yes gene_type:complete
MTDTTVTEEVKEEEVKVVKKKKKKEPIEVKVPGKLSEKATRGTLDRR